MTTRGTKKKFWLFMIIGILSTLCAPHAAVAQATAERPIVDARGVDVAAGEVQSQTPSLDGGDLDFAKAWSGAVGYGTTDGVITGLATNRKVTLNGKTLRFISNGAGGFVAANGDGSTLVQPAGTQGYVYTASDGTRYEFTRLVPSGPGFPTRILSHLQRIVRSDGTVFTYHYKISQGSCADTPGCAGFLYARLQSIVSSRGHMLKFSYAAQSAYVDPVEYERLVSVRAIALAADYCNPAADSCTATTPDTPSLAVNTSTSGGSTITTVTDDDNNQTVVTAGPSGVTTATAPGSASNAVAASYDASGRVQQLTSDGVTYNYGYSVSGNIQTATVTAPGGSTETYVVDKVINRPVTITDASGRTTNYQYDASGRKTLETLHEGNATRWTYDGRGNVTEVRRIAKPGSGLADIVSTAAYPASCANILTCNKPDYVIDAGGNRTDYSYDATHGGVTRVQLPAAALGQPRPEINYIYSALQPKIKNSSDILVPNGATEYKVTGIASCAVAATCAGSANETRILLAYDTPDLQLSSKTVTAGDGSLSATESYTYGALGHLRSVDGPLPGTDDTIYYFSGPRGLLRGVIGPDPDGAGPRLRAATRYAYDARKRVIREDAGTANGTDGAALTAMTVSETVDIVYDANGRMVKRSVSAGGAVQAVEQASYDTLGRLACTALRMNPAVFASLPANACTAGTTGANGPDRISLTTYDPAGRVVKVESAVGTGAAADEVRTGYTNNGATDYVIDAENNRTKYSYDGHDRLVKTEYPSTTKGANAANASDYEQLGYDASGNITSRRLRDGTSIGYGYDNLGRLVSKDLPGSEPDIAYGYDLLDRALSATQATQALSFTHDALGRNLTQVGPQGTITYGYDAAGRRTSMAYPGGALTLSYDYDVTGNVTAIRENGAASGVGVLASYAFDNLGRRTSVNFGNGSVQSFGYDAASRLVTLTNNLGGAATTHDLTQSFGYNPASQITSVARSNDAYAWQAHYNVDRAYVIDGLNRIMNAGSVAFGYDARGNLTGDGTNAYSYTAENLLKSGPGGATLGYDPLGRLTETAKVGVTTRLQYDGADLIAEYNGSNAVQRRYVHGPGTDNPIVWYEGGTIDSSTRRFLMADERGSVVSITDSGGATIHINAYDEYGIPAPNNIGRFGYTGQTWLPEVRMWHYKARIYSPTLGRFMQTDPIGYEDGMNWYNYVGSDPVNTTDPFGLERQYTDPPIDVIANCKKGWTCRKPNLARVVEGPGGGPPGGGGSGPQNDDCTANPQNCIVVTGQRLAQLVIPLPGRRYTPIPPWVLRGRNRSNDPPFSPPDRSDEEEENKCEAGLEKNNSQCKSVWPPYGFPSRDVNSQERRLCYSRAMATYAGCLSGKNIPFDPYGWFRD